METVFTYYLRYADLPTKTSAHAYLYSYKQFSWVTHEMCACKVLQSEDLRYHPKPERSISTLEHIRGYSEWEWFNDISSLPKQRHLRKEIFDNKPPFFLPIADSVRQGTQNQTRYCSFKVSCIKAKYTVDQFVNKYWAIIIFLSLEVLPFIPFPCGLESSVASIYNKRVTSIKKKKSPQAGRHKTD